MTYVLVFIGGMVFGVLLAYVLGLGSSRNDDYQAMRIEVLQMRIEVLRRRIQELESDAELKQVREMLNALPFREV